MKSLTIHGLDDHLYQLLTLKAREKNLSLNKTIKQMLNQYLNPSAQVPDHSTDFKEFLGVWNKEEAESFNQIIKKFDTVNPEEWE